MNRWTFYDVVFTDNYVPGKRQTSIFTFDEYAGSSVIEQWGNKYPQTTIVGIHRISTPTVSLVKAPHDVIVDRSFVGIPMNEYGYRIELNYGYRENDSIPPLVNRSMY